jgi:hypothetical protein
VKDDGRPIAYTPLYLGVPRTLDGVLEEMARRERRTKVAVMSLSPEEYAQHHHADPYEKYREAGG